MYGTASPTGPGLVRKAANFAVAVMRHVAAGRPAASTEEVARRKAVCESCEYLSPDGLVCRHSGCGCVLATKVAWAEQQCPIGKW
jgi:hypothetical protein